MADEQPKPTLSLNLTQADFQDIQQHKVSGLENKVSPKEMVLNFARATQEPNINDFTFTINGSALDADNYIHRMRTELSRFRKKVIDKGRQPNYFKLYKKRIYCADMVCEITLTKAPEVEVSKELSEAIDLFSIKEGKE